MYQPPHIGLRVRAKCLAALKALRERVPIEGPHADIVAFPPERYPTGRGRQTPWGSPPHKSTRSRLTTFTGPSLPQVDNQCRWYGLQPGLI